MSSLLIDYRESELIQNLRVRNISFESVSLPVGDIWIGLQLSSGDQKEPGDEKQSIGGLVIERKRIKRNRRRIPCNRC